MLGKLYMSLANGLVFFCLIRLCGLLAAQQEAITASEIALLELISR